jgi:hypothetical protein
MRALRGSAHWKCTSFTGVEVLDVTVASVEQVEDTDGAGECWAEVVTRFGIDLWRWVQAHRIVLGEWGRAEIAQVRTAEPSARSIDLQAERSDPLRRVGQVLARGGTRFP